MANTFYGNSLNPYQLAGLSPGETDISIGDLLDSMNGRRDGVDFRDARSAIGSNPWRDLGFIVSLLQQSSPSSRIRNKSHVTNRVASSKRRSGTSSLASPPLQSISVISKVTVG